MACLNACPTQAIYVAQDINGYEKIAIHEEKCVQCGLCEKVCQRRSEVSRSTPVTVYAAQAADKDALGSSASGGAFQVLAQIVLEKGGVCYGCEFLQDGGKFCAKHVRVDSLQQLPRILNSKYIPSMIGDTFRQAKQDLQSGIPVLFSGTPCQIKGLRAYLNEAYDNLLTADLICHGVPSTNLFQNYIQHLEQKEGIVITDYYFRDKTISWGTNFCFSYYKKDDPKKRIRTRHCPREESSYFAHYLKRNIFRENCYSCDCANTERVSDFTLGDFWEIEREYPEFITKYKPRIVVKSGISCILVNSEKGSDYIHLLRERMILREATLDSVVAHNSNLRAPSSRGKNRQWLLDTYRTEGYAPIEAEYRKRIGNRIWVYRLKNILKSNLPDVIRILIYRSSLLRRIVFH